MSTISFFGTLVDTINEHYELPEILNVTVMPSLRSQAGGPDSVYLITTESQSYVLRPFRTEISSAIELHNQFLLWAAQRDFSMTQRIVQTRVGNYSFESAQQRWWLSTYIEADPVFEWTKPTWTKDDCEQSGRALSSLHQALCQFATENSSLLNPTTTDGSVLRSLEKRLEHAFFKSAKFADQWMVVAPLVSKALALIQKKDSAVEQLVHGDFHPGNLLFRDGVAVAIIDFEYLNIEHAIYDLAYSLIMFCTHWADSPANPNPAADAVSVADANPVSWVPSQDGMIDMEKLQSFLRGYLFVSSEFDSELLIPYMNVAAAICLTWFLERELEDRTARHFINVVKQLQNLSTMDISRAIGRA